MLNYSSFFIIYEFLEMLNKIKITFMIFLIPFLSAEAKDNKSRLSLGGGFTIL